MIEQTAEEVAELMVDNPLEWAQQYLDVREALGVATEKLLQYELAFRPTEGEC